MVKLKKQLIMKVGIASPMSLELLNIDQKVENLPKGYPFPMNSILINGLLKEGIQIVAFTSSPGINKSFIKETENLILCVVPQATHSARYFYKSERNELVRLMKQYPCDILNAHWSYEFALAALETDIPTIVTLHDHAATILKLIVMSNNNLATKLHWFIRFFINKTVLSKAQYLSVNSEYLYGLLPNKIKRKTRIINNFYSEELQTDLIPIEEKRNIVVSVSNGFSNRKNIDSALKAFNIVREKIQDLEYYLAGDGMGKNEEAFNFACKFNLQFGVKFLGHIEYKEIKKIVSSAKIFLHPSREESFGMAVLESMVLGTTVVGGKKSGNIPRLLDYGNTGIICDINSKEEIAEAILKLYSDDKLNNNLRMNALNFAKTHYSEDKIIKQYINYYSDILSKKKQNNND